MNKKDFLKRFNLTEDQFSGKEKIEGNLNLDGAKELPKGIKLTVGGYLYLRSLTSMPEGVTLTVGGDLYLSSLTSMPEGVTLTVGGYLDLRSLTSMPEGVTLTVGGYLYLRSLTSMPEGVTLTVGGYLDLSSLTSMPEGVTLTVGGYLDLRSGRKHIGNTVPEIPKPIIDLSWMNGKYKKIDGIFCEIVSAHTVGNSIVLLNAKKLNKNEYFFIAQKDGYSAHGKTSESAIEDLTFKIASEKIKKEPINADTLITVRLYRIITGACDLGVREFMRSNEIPFKVEDDKTVEVDPIKASELLPILRKKGAYGLERFEKLITF
jgi:hypothetical protein